MGQMAQAEAVSAMMELGGFFPRVATFAMKNIYGTSPLDRFTRNVGNLSGHAHSRALLYGFRDAVRAGNQPEAKKRRPYIREIFAEDPKLLGEILNANYTDARLDELAILGGQIVGDRAAGNTLAAYLPLNAKHPLLGPLYSLSLFTIRMTDESYRNFDPKDPTSLVNNPAVIARWLSGMAATFGVTMGVLQLKRLMRHEDLESLDEMVEWQRVRDTLGFMGFYTGIMDGADIVMGRYGPFAERAGGPVYSKAAELIGAAGTSARTGDGRAIGRSWIYTIPKGWWNLLGVPTPKELADDAYPRKKRRPSPP